MLVTPLLSHSVISHLDDLFKHQATEKTICNLLYDFSLEEQIHMLRFLYNKSDISQSYVEDLYAVWKSLLPSNNQWNTQKNRDALLEIGQWWDTFGVANGKTVSYYNELEQALDTIGKTSEGVAFFKWVLLSPVWAMPVDLLDDHRRGAVVCLGKYASSEPDIDLFLARHLDDQYTIQVEVISVLYARRSRLFGKLAPWYLANDEYLQPILMEYF